MGVKEKAYEESQEWAIRYVPKRFPWRNTSSFIVHAKSESDAREHFEKIMPNDKIVSCEYYGPYIYF